MNLKYNHLMILLFLVHNLKHLLSYHFVIAKFSPIYPYVFTSKIMLLPYDWDYNTRLAFMKLIEWTQLAGYVRLRRGGADERSLSRETMRSGRH
jgi:hypothetical protein